MKGSEFVVLLNRVAAFLGLIFAFAALPPFAVWRYLVGLYLHRKYNKPIEFLRGFDAFFAIDDAKTPFVAGGCHVFEGTCDIEKLRQRVDERWLQPHGLDGRWKHMKLRQELKEEFEYFFWIPQTEFRIENHVKRHDGPPLETKEDLQQLIARLFANLPVEKGILWQILLVDLSDTFLTDKPRAQHLILPYASHATFDGISFNRMYAKLFDDEIDAVLPTRIGGSQIGLFERVAFWMNVFVHGPFGFLRELLLNEKHFLLGAPMTGNKLISISGSIGIEKVKKVKNFYKTTVNDVLQASVVGALRRDVECEGFPLPMVMTFRVPVSFQLLQEEAKVENNISSGRVHVPVEELTCVGRLVKTKAAVDEMKISSDLYLSYVMCRFFLNRIPLVFTLDFVNRYSSTAVVSCIPMTMPKRMLGNGALQQHYVVGMPNGVSGCGMAVTISSTADTVVFAFNADSGVVESQERLDRMADFVLMEIDELYQSIDVKRT